LSDSYFSSTRINESLLVAALDGDPEAIAIIESWHYQYKVIIVDADDPILLREGMVTFG
jgi:hypothetical protein